MNTSLIVTIITAILGSGILSTLISHALYTRKLKKEQSMKADYGAGVKTAKALWALKELLSNGSAIEIYKAEKVMQEPGFSTLDGNVIYPEILNDKESLLKFLEALRQFRKEYEFYIDCELALKVVLIDRYLSQLILFLNSYSEKYWPDWGAIFIDDIQNLFHQCDKCIIKKINRQKYKLEYHNGLKWKILRHRLLEKPFNDTILVRMDKGNLSEMERQLIVGTAREINI